ncbi:hypothetical protein [Paenibacillus cellulositrophicus]|uniref:hypothetical protein n=1 Tax=Paenibacillus cellulositrophicus TaxID=562959 RepID=UPI003D961A92
MSAAPALVRPGSVTAAALAAAGPSGPARNAARRLAVPAAAGMPSGAARAAHPLPAAEAGAREDAGAGNNGAPRPRQRQQLTQAGCCCLFLSSRMPRNLGANLQTC